jgi:DNA-binding IclR family transcriptional regulator
LASSTQKTFKCLEALSRSPHGLTASEVAAVTGFSRPAATRLLEALVADSIILRDRSTKRYRLGLKLHEWANAAIQVATPINIARREFIKLSMELHRECNFLVLEGLEGMLVERAEEVDGVPVNRPMLARRAWHLTSTGKAIVAFSAPDFAKSILERTGRIENPPNLESLAAELEQARERGFALQVGIRPEGLQSIGVPVIGQTGYAVAAIGSVIAISELESPEGQSVVAQMKATASRISHYLGYEADVALAVS